LKNGKRAIITGIAGQDGSYLAELLIERGYRVLGFLKSGDDTSVLSHLMKDIVLEETELVRKDDIIRWTRTFSPDEIYNFAAVSFIPDSWSDPYRAFQVNTLLVAAFLEVIKEHCKGSRFYQASSSEIFGDPRNRRRPREPRTIHDPVRCQQARRAPVGWTVPEAAQAVRGFRDPIQPRIPRRPERFVTRKSRVPRRRSRTAGRRG